MKANLGSPFVESKNGKPVRCGAGFFDLKFFFTTSFTAFLENTLHISTLLLLLPQSAVDKP